MMYLISFSIIDLEKSTFYSDILIKQWSKWIRSAEKCDVVEV